MTTRPERPIDSPAADRLERGPFISRLCDALVDPAGRARGVVVGVTGPWGSGKSSLLNLLQAELERRHPAAVVVRFDPWLVSGRDDVITQFFLELLRTIESVGTTNGRHGDMLRDLGRKLAGYAKDLAPAAGLFSLVPGVGAAAAGVAKAAETLLTRDTSLATQRRELAEMLAGVEVPIIVLIDELDRVEDAEVRAVAQLVRAVADFPGLSYVLAYDRDRVVEALGGGQRGTAYLEKIVQFQVPLPVSLEDEMRGLLLTELTALADEGTLPKDWRENARFATLVEIALSGLVETPRDVRRVTGAYAVLAPMVQDEVEWVDLLGYCILLCKAPGAVDALRRRPEDAVVDPLSTQAMAIYLRNRDASRETRLQAFGVTPTDAAAPLLGFLFPYFADERGARDDVPDDTIRHRRPLATVLRLGLLPGGVSRQEVRAFLTLTEEAMAAELRQRSTDGRLPALVDRLHEVYREIEDPDPSRTWRSLGSFLEPSEPAWPTRFDGAPDLLRAFERIIHRSLKARPSLSQHLSEALADLIARRHYAFAAHILRSDFFAYGLYGAEKRGTDGSVLPVETVHDLSRRLADAAHEDHLRGAFLPRLRTIIPLFLISEVDRWDAACRARLDEAIRQDDAAVIALAIIGCGGHYETERSGYQRFTDADALFQRFTEVLDQHRDRLDPSAQAALRSALGHW